MSWMWPPFFFSSASKSSYQIIKGFESQHIQNSLPYFTTTSEINMTKDGKTWWRRNSTNHCPLCHLRFTEIYTHLAYLLAATTFRKFLGLHSTFLDRKIRPLSRSVKMLRSTTKLELALPTEIHTHTHRGGERERERWIVGRWKKGHTQQKWAKQNPHR